jgi:nicotinate-nucleotide--dimethylbenzimidazole phosphoribosyltransferase
MPPFQSFAEFRAVLRPAPPADAAARARARARQARLTKPPGSLGRLEEIAEWVAGWQRTDRPRIERPQVVVCAGNHGVAARGVSAYPPEVTAQMVANFHAGGAAINQIARAVGARLDVVAIELDRPTADMTRGPAMTEAECVAALAAGWNAVAADADLVVPGEMGIGATTAAAAVAAALLGGAPGDWVGRGTGLDDAGVARKEQVVAAALAANPEARNDGLEALRRLGGREIAGMAGVIAAARSRGIPCLLDGFISTAAGLALAKAVPGALDHARAGHQSAEAAHGAMLERLGLEPILALGLRLGEGTGAALAVAVLRAACDCLSGMATFEEAGVSG